ncbi:O-antigen ligase family protein [Wenzhouxiangella sp. EGI_FJ10409]|uniref:O-antigen ligase family protein n=1 Tax=Wenzhouxiangella sp. EGI_FJ10409 TaxID=3243767 RepID=UPI0035E08E5A
MNVSNGRSFSDRRPRLLAWLAMMVGFLTVFDWYTVSGIPFLRNPSAVVAIGMILAYLAIRGPTYKLTSRDWPHFFLLLFLVYSFALELLRQLFIGYGSPVSFFIWYMQYVQVAILFFLVSDICRDPRHLFIIWGGVIAGILFIALAVVFEIPGFTQEITGQQRKGFSELNLNRAAFYYALGIITLLWVLIERRFRLDWISAACALGICTLALPMVWTGSRGPFIAFVAGAAVLLTVSLRRQNIKNYLSFVPLAIGGMTVLVLQSEVLLFRFEQAATGEQMGLRDIIFSRSMELIGQRPVSGYGREHTQLIGQALGYAGGYSPHNLYFQVVLSFGLIGLLLWLAFMAQIALKLLRRRRNPTSTLFFSLLACSAVYGLTGGIAHDKFFWFVLGLSVFAWRAELPSWMRNRPRANRRQRKRVIFAEDGSRT